MMTLASCVHFTDATTTFVPCDLFSVLINITFFFYEALRAYATATTVLFLHFHCLCLIGMRAHDVSSCFASLPTHQL